MEGSFEGENDKNGLRSRKRRFEGQNSTYSGEPRDWERRKSRETESNQTTSGGAAEVAMMKAAEHRFRTHRPQNRRLDRHRSVIRPRSRVWIPITHPGKEMSPISEKIDSKEKKKELKNGWCKENLSPRTT